MLLAYISVCVSIALKLNINSSPKDRTRDYLYIFFFRRALKNAQAKLRNTQQQMNQQKEEVGFVIVLDFLINFHVWEQNSYRK